MLCTISQVNEEFFKMFQGMSIVRKGKNVPLNVRYARMSANDYSEEQTEQKYPCIAIQDYTPTIKPEWYIDARQYFGGVADSDTFSGFLYSRPIWMEFRFDVSIAAKGYYDYMAMKDLFTTKFQSEIRFVFNKFLEGDDMVGDIVPFTVRPSDIPRSDGVLETNYEFTLSVWLYAREPKEVELVKEIVVRGHPMELSS